MIKILSIRHFHLSHSLLCKLLLLIHHVLLLERKLLLLEVMHLLGLLKSQVSTLL